MRRLIAAAIAATLAAPATITARAEGLVWVPGLGYRAAPCCRDRGFPGFQGRPPNEFLYGVLAPVFWGEIIPRLMERFPPPPAYAYAPPVYRRSPPPPPAIAQPAPPPEPSAEPLDREQWKQRLLSEGKEFCATYPDDPVCGR